MDIHLSGKNVFITASSGGIGKATAVAFLEEGATVVINGRDGTKLSESLSELRGKYGKARVYGFCGDMSVDASIKEATEYIKRELQYIDVAVGNLGTGKPISEDKFDDREWRHMFELNLFGAVGLIRNIGDLFPETGGSIVLLSSLAAHERIGAPPAYAAAKAAVVSLVKYAAPILMKQGVRINAVSPGNIFFEGGRWEELSEQDPVGVRTYLETAVPMKRFGTPREIADTILFLCSEKSTFTTGTVVQVDGGQGTGY